MSKRLLVWDNGASYSDHTIHFVEAGDCSDALLRAIGERKSMECGCKGGRSIGIMVADWWEGATEPLVEFIPHEGDIWNEDMETDESGTWGIPSLLERFPDEFPQLLTRMQAHRLKAQAAAAERRAARGAR